jgi:HAD superfamily hydrolase (TIGR01662 family)
MPSTTWPPVRAVLLDVYDTLVDAGPQVRIRALDGLAERLGLNLAPRALWDRRAEVFGSPRPLRFHEGGFRPLRDWWHEDGQRLLADLDVTEGGLAYAEAWNTLHSSAAAFPDTPDALRHLDGAYLMGVVADADRAHLVPCLRSLGVPFGVVVCSEDLLCYKPDPALFLRACDALDVRPDASVFIGDRPEADVAGAAAVGMRTIWINRRAQVWPQDVPPPTATVTSLAAVPNELARLEEPHP